MPAQLVGLLLDEDDEDPGDSASGGTVRLPQRTLAAMLGVARPSLNNILKEFERRRHVAIGYSSVQLVDADALRRMVKSPGVVFRGDHGDC